MRLFGYCRLASARSLRFQRGSILFDEGSVVNKFLGIVSQHSIPLSKVEENDFSIVLEKLSINTDSVECSQLLFEAVGSLVALTFALALALALSFARNFILRRVTLGYFRARFVCKLFDGSQIRQLLTSNDIALIVEDALVIAREELVAVLDNALTLNTINLSVQS